MFDKPAALESPAYLGFVRRQRCAFCDAGTPSQAHHYPFRSQGATDDSKTLPVCTWCHQRCHGITVTIDGQRFIPIGESEQEEMTLRILRRFLDTATDDELKSYLRALQTWRARPLSVPF